MTRVSRHLDAEQISGYVEINREDTASLNLKEADSVVLCSSRGRMEAPAKLRCTVEPGVFFLPIHFGESPANVLTNPVFDPIAKIPEFKVSAVKAEKLKEWEGHRHGFSPFPQDEVILRNNHPIFFSYTHLPRHPFAGFRPPWIVRQAVCYRTRSEAVEGYGCT